MDVKPKVFTGPLSFTLLMDAFINLTYGYDEPDVIKCNSKMINKLSIVCRFGIDAVTDNSLPDNEIIMTYKKIPALFSHPNSAISIIRISDENPY